MRVNLRARDRDRAGSSMVREKSVPQGPDESSPVRSAGLAFLKSYPSRTVTGRVFLLHFPALRTGLLSLSPSETSPHRTILTLKLTRMG